MRCFDPPVGHSRPFPRGNWIDPRDPRASFLLILNHLSPQDNIFTIFLNPANKRKILLAMLLYIFVKLYYFRGMKKIFALLLFDNSQMIS